MADVAEMVTVRIPRKQADELRAARSAWADCKCRAKGDECASCVMFVGGSLWLSRFVEEATPVDLDTLVIAAVVPAVAAAIEKDRAALALACRNEAKRVRQETPQDDNADFGGDAFVSARLVADGLLEAAKIIEARAAPEPA